MTRFVAPELTARAVRLSVGASGVLGEDVIGGIAPKLGGFARVSAPESLTNETDASFVFSASEAGSSFQWSPEGTSPTTCQRPASQLALESGPHTFEVWAPDEAENADAASAAHTWTIGATERHKPVPLPYVSKGREAS